MLEAVGAIDFGAIFRLKKDAQKGFKIEKNVKRGEAPALRRGPHGYFRR
jgi:hypothetical protein